MGYICKKAATLVCPPGYYGPSGGAPCSPCPSGTYSRNSNSSECTPCSPGSSPADDRVSCVVGLTVNASAAAPVDCSKTCRLSSLLVPKLTVHKCSGHRNSSIHNALPCPSLLPLVELDGTALCALCSVLCTLCSVICALYSVLCTLYSVPYALCSVLCTLCSVLCTLCSVICTLCSVLCALYPVLFALCSLQCAMCYVLCALCQL